MTRKNWHHWLNYILFAITEIIFQPDAVNYSKVYSGPGEVVVDQTTGDVTLTLNEDQFKETNKEGFFKKVNIDTKRIMAYKCQCL